MPQNYFLTGMPKAGKTTVLLELVDELKRNGLKVGGFISPDEKHHGTRTAFHIMDVNTRKKAVLADVHGDGPKVSKYHVNIKSFEAVALPAMKKCKQCDVFIIDEIGRMEMKSRKFVKELDNVLDSKTPLIASLSRDYEKKFSALGKIMRITPGNREIIHRTLLEEALLSLEKRPAKKKPKPKKKKPVPKKKKPVRKATKKKATKKKKAKPKKKKKAAPKKAEKKKAPKKEAPPPKEETKVRLEEEEEHEKEEKGFFGKLKDAFGF